MARLLKPTSALSFLFNTRSVLLLADLCGLISSLGLALLLRVTIGEGSLSPSLYFHLGGAIPFFLLLYAALELYPGVFLPPHVELKRLSLGSSLGFAFLNLLIFLGKQGEMYSRFVLIGGWLLSVFLVPLARYGVRTLCAKRAWWGYPVLLLAPENRIADTLVIFREQRRRGLYITGVVTLKEGETASDASLSLHLAALARPETGERLAALAKAYPGSMALVLTEDLPPQTRQEIIPLITKYFHRILVRTSAFWLRQSSLRIAFLPCGQVLTLRQNLLDPARMRVKRLLDIVFCLAGGIVLILIIPVIALCIRLESKGPIFFRHARIGSGGKIIRIFKFRTMVADAEERLRATLDADQALREEWEATQKLSRDPRLTRVGAFLRASSLDELPQIFNVLKGEMSLVGPRPVPLHEEALYGDAFELYCRVKPGITGLWQISGRNDISYAKRLETVYEYVYNWSVWLDIYIIMRTVPVVLSGKGAY
ncbi:MAG: undecaprenyl-phosphate galactose phosphotransferase WbaP [Desulfovibrio sp.]|jgi:Undecaprenyl-phosphate galactose phosphotransferase WbaP|nr:undecaprenyl-phosphate galactose phosphotransferase WbaP [Desulfovibrio sp.]